MSKKFWLAFIAVFVTTEVFNFLIHGVLLQTEYQASASVWRPDMMRLTWVYHVISLVASFFFTLVFSKGYEGKGIAEGVRFGLYIGIWLSMSMAYGTYAMIAVPYAMAVKWFLAGIVEYVVMGIVAAAILKGKSA